MNSLPGRQPDPSADAAFAVPRPAGKLLALAAALLLAFAGFVALGTWQLYRLQWKLALIDRVESRVHAAAVPAPGPRQWPQVTAAGDEYRHVTVSGSFMNDRSTRVLASTELGSGYWLITPLRTRQGWIVLINRGFLPPGWPASASNAANLHGEVTVTGLLRMSEPGGAFLRHNDPARERWFSRDVQAIATQRGLSRIAPYFIDADADGSEAGEGMQAAPRYPAGGLTVIKFHNNHLVYAFTWYALALMVAGAGIWAVRGELRRRKNEGRPEQTGDQGKGHGRQ